MAARSACSLPTRSSTRDYTRSSAYGDFEAQGARSELSANLGATKVTQGTESLTGPLAKLKLSRKLVSAAKLTFTAGRDITDGSTSFSNLQSGAISTIGTVLGGGRAQPAPSVLHRRRRRAAITRSLTPR